MQYAVDPSSLCLDAAGTRWLFIETRIEFATVSSRPVESKVTRRFLVKKEKKKICERTSPSLASTRSRISMRLERLVQGQRTFQRREIYH